MGVMEPCRQLSPGSTWGTGEAGARGMLWLHTGTGGAGLGQGSGGAAGLAVTMAVPAAGPCQLRVPARAAVPSCPGSRALPAQTAGTTLPGGTRGIRSVCGRSGDRGSRKRTMNCRCGPGCPLSCPAAALSAGTLLSWGWQNLEVPALGSTSCRDTPGPAWGDRDSMGNTVLTI